MVRHRMLFVGSLLVAGGIVAAGLVCLSFGYKSFSDGNGAQGNRAAVAEKEALPVVALITPHHLAAREYMHKVFQEVSDRVGKNVIDRVILVSPNHFGIGKSWVIGSDRDWETPLGVLQGDKVLAEQLGDVTFIRGDILEREHGVRNIFPFIKQYFPRATVMPLALRDGFPDEKADALAQRLSRLPDAHTLLVVSADFSHYLDWNFSRFHDDKSLEVLRNTDLLHVDSLDVDCSSCVRLALGYAALRNAAGFQFVSRSSALELSGANRVGEETSHITGYFSSETLERSDTSIHLLFSGRVSPLDMTENARRIFMSQGGNVFEQNDKLFWNVFDSRTHALVSFPQSNQPLLRDDENTSIRTFGERRIAFIRVDGDRYARDGFGEVSRTLDEAKQQSDVRVVLWKGLSVYGSERQRYMRALVDAGADMVIGFDATQIEPMEIYKEKAIFPSLGNISLDCRDRKIVCEGVMIGIDAAPGKIKYLFMPVVMEKDGKVALATGRERAVMLEKLASEMSDERLKVSLESGVLVPDAQ